MHSGRKRAIERRIRMLLDGIQEAKARLAALTGRTDLTERGRKQQETLLRNRIRQMEMLIRNLQEVLERG